MNGSRFDEISITSGNDGGLTIHIQVQRTLEHDVGLIPVMGMRRLTNTTRCFEFGNAVLAIGLISRQTQGDASPSTLQTSGLLLESPNTLWSEAS